MKYQKRQTKASPGDYILTILPLATAKTYLLEGSGTDQDAIITDLIEGAVQYIESGLDYIVDTSGLIYQYYDAFPTDGILPIWHRYIKETDLVVQYWSGSAWTSFASTNYRIDTAATPPRVFLKSTASWPDLTDPDSYNMVRVGFKWDVAHSFIHELRAATMAYVAWRYENREGSSGIPQVLTAFIDRHKLHS
jgi:hypothetical protein